MKYHILFAAVVFTTGVSQLAAGAGFDSGRLKQIPELVKAFVEAGTIAGAVTLAVRHGEVASLEAVGYRGLETRQPMRADTIFQIASMTKPVTATGVMILAEEGRLALSDPVEKYLPEFRGMWVIGARDRSTRTLNRPSRPITIHDLMTHTSGMGDYPEILGDAAARRKLTLAEAVHIYSQQPLEFQPGTRWMYSSPGINTLGRILEVVSDQSCERFLEERIFKPLGMSDTFFIPPPGKYDRIASVYDLRNGKLTRADIDLHRVGWRYTSASGGLFSTASDMAAFYQMMLRRGVHKGKRILSQRSVDVMTALHTGDLPPTSPGMGYGLGWEVVRDLRGALRGTSIGSYGHGGAYGTYGWIDPKADLVGVFLIQRASGGAPDERNAFVQMLASAIVD